MFKQDVQAKTQQKAAFSPLYSILMRLCQHLRVSVLVSMRPAEPTKGQVAQLAYAEPLGHAKACTLKLGYSNLDIGNVQTKTILVPLHFKKKKSVLL